MNDLEFENNEKRKSKSLTTGEWLTFFFLPFYSDATKNFSDKEEERFEKYGFETKQKQSIKVRDLGGMFYGLLLLFIVLIAVINK